MPLKENYDITALEDGIYEGECRKGPCFAKVKVTVSGGHIKAIEILKHFGSWKRKEPEHVIPLRIIEAQSPKVDSITGATMSSEVIMCAVGNALDLTKKDNK